MFVLFLCSLVLAGRGVASVKVDRISGGTLSGDEFSFMVSLRDDRENAHFCGGTLISKSVVLTAAHCLSSFSVGEVWIGGTNRTDRDGFEVRNVSRIDKHEFYGSLGGLNDIALLHLSSPSTKVSVAVNGDLNLEDADREVTVLGWGASEDGGASAQNLQTAVLPMISFADCLAYSPEDIQPGMICAGASDGGQATCAGDDGGPALAKFGGRWVQTGIVSGGFGCGSNCEPAVLTQLTAYSCWIEQLAPDASAAPEGCNATIRPVSTNDEVRASKATCDLASGVIGLLESDVLDRLSCFPSDGLVELEGGGVRRMDELQIGDRVRSSDSGFSAVYFFSHRDPGAWRSDFVSITLSTGARLDASPGHLVPVDGDAGLTAAARVSRGMSVGGAAVAQVTHGVGKAGLFNPHTAAGTIVVNGVLASCYTTAVDPRAARWLLLPLRASWRALGHTRAWAALATTPAPLHWALRALRHCKV